MCAMNKKSVVRGIVEDILYDNNYAYIKEDDVTEWYTPDGIDIVAITTRNAVYYVDDLKELIGGI